MRATFSTRDSMCAVIMCVLREVERIVYTLRTFREKRIRVFKTCWYEKRESVCTLEIRAPAVSTGGCRSTVTNVFQIINGHRSHGRGSRRAKSVCGAR